MLRFTGGWSSGAQKAIQKWAGGRRLLGKQGGKGAGRDLCWREPKALEGLGEVSLNHHPQESTYLLPTPLTSPASAEAEELYQKRVLTITGICVALLVVGIVCVVAYCKTK